MEDEHDDSDAGEAEESETEEPKGFFALPLEERKAALPKKLAGQTLRLAAPRDLMEREDIVNAALECDGRSQPFVRVMAAALLLCWSDARSKEGAPRYKYDVFEYGGRAYAFLFGKGASENDIIMAGNVAVNLCVDAVRAQRAAQEEARGNSATPAGGGDSSSSSALSNGSGLLPVVLASSRPR